jgi:choline dehydrogenase
MEADIIVVGGGSAGCAMAGRLASQGVKVLLLEAGKTDKHYRLRIPALTSSVVQNTDFDWKYVAEPDPTIGGRADVWPGGKRLGGGSSINGMMYVRGHSWDYDHWAELGARGWAFKDVAPYFARMETNSRGPGEHRGTSGPVGVSDSRLHYPIVDDWVKAAESFGIERNPDHNGANPGEGTDYAQLTQKNGLRSSSVNFLKLPGAAQNLTVELEAQALKVLVEDGRAVGVEYRHDGQTKRAMANRGVIVSSGALNTPRLLMLSGIGPAAHLQEMGIPVVLDLPGVGRNLQEHVGTHLVNDVNTTTLNGEARGWPLVKVFADFILRRKGVLTTSVGQAQAFLRTRPGLKVPNVQISFTCFAFDLDKEGKLVLRHDNAVSTVACVSRPQSRGTLTLRSADPLAPPVIRHQLLAVEDDVEQLAEGLEIARQIMEQPQIKPYVTSEVRPGKDVTGAALRQYCHFASIPLYHPVGTCRMGEDRDAVVDPDLRVRGIEGLWVADASVFPCLASGNTNATAMMIGDKGSDHVLRALHNAPIAAPAA